MKRFLPALAGLLMAATPAVALDTYVGEIMTTAGTFCPVGWLPANGQILSITQNMTLYSILGPQYGGDGQSTFALPTFRPVIDAKGATLMTCIAIVGVYPSPN